MKSPELAHRDRLIRIARRAMTERGLLPEFSAEVLAEAESIAGPAADRDVAIRDLRHLLWCSIDNDDSLDLDQLTVAEVLPDGATKILVAIADVDALVKTGSATDSHAAENAMSVYTAAIILPMLPERLSNDLSSLNEGQERMAIVVEAVIAADGGVTESDVYRALVLNHAKLNYDAVAAWLEGEAPAPPALASGLSAGSSWIDAELMQ